MTLNHRLFILLNGLVTICSQICTELSFISKKNNVFDIKSSKSGDYIIPCIFSITKSDDCRQVSSDGLIRVFAVKYAINEIKKENNLPNITLGYEFYDACFSLPKTMSHGIEIVKNYRRDYCFNNSINTSVQQENSVHQKISVQQKNSVIAVVGEYYSFTTISLASLLSLHNIPQISDGAPSPLLSDRNRFKTFFRTIQPDNVQIEMITAVLKRFKWKYIFAIGSDDDYGKIALNALKRETSEEGLCVIQDVYIPLLTSRSQMQQFARNVVMKLKDFEKAKVVVMFNYAKGMGEYVLQEAHNLNVKRVWFTSEAWNPEILTADVPLDQLQSLLSISLKYGDVIPEFKLFINETVRNEYNCDIWLKEWVKTEFNCNVYNKTQDGKFLFGYSLIANENCQISVDNIVAVLYKQNLNQVNYLINAVLAIGQSLRNAACNRTKCTTNVLPGEISTALKNVSFNTTSGQFFEFGLDHNPKFSQYTIEQIHLNGSVAKYVHVGNWDTQKASLNISLEKLKWPTWLQNKSPVSTCNADCVPGEMMIAKQKCCWVCKSCPKNQVSNSSNAENCSLCPDGYYTKDNIKCFKIPIRYISYSHQIGVFSIILSGIGMLLSLGTSIIFLVLRRKSTAFMQDDVMSHFVTSSFLPVLSFCYTFLELGKPSKSVCLAQDFYLNLMLTSNGLLILSMNLSVRHFFTKFVSRKFKKPLPFFIIFLLVIEICLLLVWMKSKKGFVHKIIFEWEFFERCAIDSSVYYMVIKLYPALLLLTATILTFSERSSKYNFSELRNLYFFGMSHCIITIAYGLTINEVNDLYKPLVLLITTNGYGFAFIFCLTIPKIYIILTVKRKSKKVIG